MKKRKIVIWVLVVVAFLLIGSSVVMMLLPNMEGPKGENPSSKPSPEEIYYIESDGQFKKNNSEKLRSQKEKDGLIFTEIDLTDAGVNTAFTANVTNITEQDQEAKRYKIVFVDKENKKIAEIPLAVPALKAKETNIVITETLLDVVNAYDFQIIEA